VGCERLDMGPSTFLRDVRVISPQH
jgi:hypothetical protein